MNMLSKETSFQPAQPAPTAAPSVLASRAMLADLSIRTWEPVKADKRVAKEAEASNGAQAGTARVTKTLIAREALSEITAVCSEARKFHYSLVQPWVFRGPGILSAMAHDKYLSGMDSFRARFETARAGFLPLYPELVRAAPAALGSMFNPADYPSESEISRAFSFEVRFFPVPTAADFRVDLSAAQAEEIRAQIERASAEALATAQKALWARVLEPVAKMSETLKAYQPGAKGVRATGTFKDSLVSNVQEVIESLPYLNLTEDPAIDSITARLRGLVQYEAEALRVSEPLRKDVQAEAAAIAAEVALYMA